MMEEEDEEDTYDLSLYSHERERAWRRDDLQVTNRTSSSGSLTSISTEIHEDSHMLMVAVDNSKVFSPSNRQSGDKDGYLLPEFIDLVKEFDFNAHKSGTSPNKDETPRSDVETPRSFKGAEKVNYEQEIKHLKNMVGMLRERERNLEVQMLEFYGLREQETAVMELQNQRLHDQVAEHVKVVCELNAARAKIKMLKKTQRSEAEQNKEQIVTLQNTVSRLQEQELKSAATDSDIQMKLQRLKDLETETEELRKSYSRLHLENSEMASQLESTKILANSILEDPETETLRKLGNQLRQENEDLVKEVERLQADRCTDVEELVYLRWINACLRYELRNLQPPHGKTVARDLSKSLSPRSEERAKQLILEYANTEGMMEKGNSIMEFGPDHWSSSRASYMTDLGELDDSPSPKTNNSGKTKIFHKLRRLLLGKDRTRATGCSDSPNGSVSISTPTDPTSDLQSTRGRASSFYLSRHSSHSMDTQRTRSLENSRRNSEAGSSHWYRGCSSSRASDLSLDNLLDQDSYSIEKSELSQSELVKFAEVLKDPESRAVNGNKMDKLHRKSVSVGSFEALHRSSE
ncbi:PROTEIN CHUP1 CHLOROPLASTIC [Salix purpurea]|uniref:PROTEIN CHUP1 CHLOROPLASTIC n=1 Tax=Salix purpurea TaxID=77065 RepID=A0A9Q0QH19_SALPP|nr:PROTEIN CHUP1 CHLOROPLASTIC [Salix purpurea]